MEKPLVRYMYMYSDQARQQYIRTLYSGTLPFSLVVILLLSTHLGDKVLD